ncbi:MAG: hypothetical protein II822_10250 [Prevotella sp.]|nr:hypothetical protein [Prevotella sp.]
MKIRQIFLGLMLLCCVGASAQQEYSVSLSPSNPLKNGNIEIRQKRAAANTEVTVTAAPSANFGLSRGVFYATRGADGKLSEPKEARNTSSYPEDRANESQTFAFNMPAADVEVWANFAALHTLRIHQTPNGKLKPLYGVDKYKNPIDSNEVRNVAQHPIVLIAKPAKGFKLLDVEVTNVPGSSFWTRTQDTIITVYMPNGNDTVHVTPTFGKSNYEVKVTGQKSEFSATVSNATPKTREEVDVTIVSNAGLIPSGITVTGCKQWWRVGKPERQSDGRWKTVYRLKVDLQDITVDVKHERVYTINVNDTKKTGRVETYLPEMIAGYPGVARDGQQIPIVFKMTAGTSVTYTASSSTGELKPLAYHNVIQNSFADQDKIGWQESADYLSWEGIPVRTDTDTDGNKFWNTSIKNSLWQNVALKGQSYPSRAVSNGKLSVAAIASINPRHARKASVCVVAGDTVVVTDLKYQGEGWQTIFKTLEVNAKADTLQLRADGVAEDQGKKRSYVGPMFDDLCLLLPVDHESIKDEDVLVFTIDKSDVTVNYTLVTQENTVTVVQQPNANVTLRNTTTGEEGETIHAAEDDIIVIKGQHDAGFVIYNMEYQQKVSQKKYALDPDSTVSATREVYYHFIMRDNEDVTVTYSTGEQLLELESNYGGSIAVNNEEPKAGETVTVTITPDSGCRLKQIKVISNSTVTVKAENVDATTGGGTYSFTMPDCDVTLRPEFIIPITTADQLDNISQKYGEFCLMNDLDLGDSWQKEIDLYGTFDGQGHSITYGGTKSLFYAVWSQASVRHLNVKANVKGAESYLGGITMVNYGLIEDCEVSGSVENTKEDSYVGGVSGHNIPNGNKPVISHCHVLCDIIGLTAYGIARQRPAAVITDNVFSGRLTSSANRPVYMICNDEPNSTMTGNRYVASSGNAGAAVTGGATAAASTELIESVKDLTDTYPVFTASIRNNYIAYTVTIADLPTVVTMLTKPAEIAAAGKLISGSVSVDGNNHLESITVSSPDGSNAQNCPFEDNTENAYTFSFTMPDHNVVITFKTAVGRYIYTGRQFAAIDDVNGIYYLARDIELNNWQREVVLNGTFYGQGHTIKYDAESSCTGLFTKVRRGSLLQGLRVEAVVTADDDCGGIVYENQGTIRDCHFSGRITRLTAPKSSSRLIAAIAYSSTYKQSLIDHCTATGQLICANNQAAVDAHPLCAQSDNNVTNCEWINSPTHHITAGNQNIDVKEGETLDELTIVDGEPLVVTGDIKVNRIVYQRPAMNQLEQWVLPFDFNRIAGEGEFEYSAIEETKADTLKIGNPRTLSLSSNASAINYKANQPWMVRTDGSGTKRYVLSKANGPITIKATYNNQMARYASPLKKDIGTLYATYSGIPAQTANDEFMYVWNSDKQEMLLSGSPDAHGDIKPFRFYLQFYNQNYKTYVRYEDTGWYEKQQSSAKRSSAVPRRASEVVTDGWQPVFLDPRQEQSITASMLDYYEVAYLFDVHAEQFGDDDDDYEPLSVVSLVYQLADGYTALPAGLPLLVRAKRGDAEPLVDEQTGSEIEALLEQTVTGDDDTSSSLDLPHYWCASYGNRLDIWPLPTSTKYADLAEIGCMMFNDDYYDQSFLYAEATDSRATAPMSYCLTVLNTDTYQLLPLMGDRVYVEFIEPDSTTGIRPLSGSTEGEGTKAFPREGMDGVYNLNGQRIGASYKGIVIQNGRKVYKK